MKNILLLLFLSSLGLNSYSQFRYKDYLEENDPTIKAGIGAYLIDFYRANNFDSLKLIASDMMLEGVENGDRFTRSIGETGIGSYFIFNGLIKEGVKYLKRSLSFFEEKEDWTRVSEIYNEIGNGYFLNGEYTNAIHVYIASQDYGKLSLDPTASFNGGIGLAKSYFAMGDTVKGIATMDEYKELALDNKKYEAAANATAYLAMIEQDRGDTDKSLSYFEKSIEYGSYSNSFVQLSHTYTNKAIILFNLGELDTSLILFKKALELRKEIKRPRQIVEGYFNLASYYIQIEDYVKAIDELDHSISLSKKSHLIVDEYDGVEMLVFVYEELGDVQMVDKLNLRLEKLDKELQEKQVSNSEFVRYIGELQKEKISLKYEKANSSNWSWFFGIGILIIIAVAIYFKLKVKNKFN